MTSKKQIEANRQNALKGGVKTEAGKAVSRMNATKYGFFSKIITEYDKLEHSDFCKEIYACFMPESEYEKQLVEILLSNFLTYRRICFVEREYIQTKLDPDIDIGIKICSHEGYQPTMKLDLLDDLNKFQKYKTSVQTNIIKLEHEIERFIENRNSDTKYIPNSVDVNVSMQNGFVFENNC